MFDRAGSRVPSNMAAFRDRRQPNEPVPPPAPIPPGRSLAQQRHDQIVEQVRARGSMRVTELAALLDVSDMTIRRDLDVLDEAVERLARLAA